MTPTAVFVPVAVTFVRAPAEAMRTFAGAGGRPTSDCDKPAFSVRYVCHTVEPDGVDTIGAGFAVCAEN